MPYRDRIYGEVTDNEDPDQQRRVKVRCPALVREDSELPFWIRPASIGRVWDVPEVKSRVELLIIAGTVDAGDMPRLDEGSMRWLPAFQDEDTIPEEIKDGYPDVFAVWTPDGSFLAFDKVTGKVSLVHKDGSRVDIETDVIQVTHKDGTQIELNDTNITLKGETLVGEGASFYIVRGDKLKTFLDSHKIWNDAHVHTGVMAGPGSTGPPAAPSTTVPADLLSTDQKVK